MNNEKDYGMVIRFNYNPSKEFVLPNSTKKQNIPKSEIRD